MADTKAAARPHGEGEASGRKGKREKPKYRGGKGMVLRFLLAMAILSGVRIAIPVDIFFNWPSIVRNSVIAIPPLICAVYVLNTSLPDAKFRGSSYVLMLLLVFPMTLFCDFVQTRFEAFFLPLNEGYAITAWERVFITAVPLFLLNLLIALSFVIIWRAAFTGGLRIRMRWWRLLNPAFWGIGFLGTVLVSYIGLLEYVMKVVGDPVLRYNIRMPEEIPLYYQITPLGNLVATYAYLPLQVFTLGFMLLWAMRMLRRGYMESLPTPPPPGPVKSAHAEERPESPREGAPVEAANPPPTKPAYAPPPVQQAPQRQAFSPQDTKTGEARGPQRPL